MKRCLSLPMIALAIILTAGSLIDAQAQNRTSLVEKVDVDTDVVTFVMRKGNYADVTMTVVGPEEFRIEQRFDGRKTPTLPVKTEKGYLPDGPYTIEVTARPAISKSQRATLNQARERGDRYEMNKLMKEMGLNPGSMVYSVNLGVVKGEFVDPAFEEEEEEGNMGALEEVPSSTPKIQSVELTGERWDAAYLPNQADVTGTAVQPIAQHAATTEDTLPFLQATANPAAAWYGAMLHNTAADGTPLTYQAFLRPVMTDNEGKLFQVHLRKADGNVYGPWQQGYFQADEGAFQATTHAHDAQPFDYLTDENPEAAEAAMPVWHTGAGTIDGSLCIGFDCPATPAFGFDTLRLQENNLRIHFEDTSTTASFPPNDWRLYANDSSNGGSSYFGVEDTSAGRFVFRVFAGARSNALTVDSQGDVGLGTTTPATDIDIKIGDTPTVRLQQDGTSGFTPQTWDVAGNEAGFFIRDATSGSTLPFRIITGGAPSQSLVIDGDGEIGISAGTNPEHQLHIVSSGGTAMMAERAGNVLIALNNTSADDEPWQIQNQMSGTEFRVTKNGTGNTEMALTDAGDMTVFGDYFSATCTSPGSPCAPDYVFEDDYPLMSLKDLATFIEQNKHLPNVPSEDDIREAGVLNHSKFQMTLLEKIEELVLYTLDQQKIIDEQQKNFEQQQQTLEALQARLTALEKAQTADQH